MSNISPHPVLHFIIIVTTCGLFGWHLDKILRFCRMDITKVPFLVRILAAGVGGAAIGVFGGTLLTHLGI